MDSRIGFSIHLTAAAQKPLGRLALHDGEILTVRVGQAAAKNRYSVTIRGTTLTIASMRKLTPGMTLHARVVMVGDRIELKILQNPMVQVTPNTGGGILPTPPPGMSKAFALLIVQSMQRSGLPVTSQAMAAIGAMVPPSRRNDPGIVRFATILFDKHLKLDPDRLDELYLTINGDRREKANGESSGRHQEREGDNPGSRSNTGTGTKPTGTGDAATESLSSQIAAQFRAQAVVRSPEDAEWAALVNHSPGEHQAWIIVPFNLGSDPTTLDGSVRFLVDTVALRTGNMRGGMPVRHAVVVVKGIGAFEIDGSPPSRVTIRAESIPKNSDFLRLLPELTEKLRNLGVKIDDTNNGGAVFDGFTAETHEIRGVDASA